MKTPFSFLIICIFIFYSCAPEWAITVHELKIKDSPIAIYQYEGWGGRDSYINGYTINDTNVKTEILEQKHLPSMLFINPPNNDSIKLLKLSQEDNFTNPTKTVLNIIDINIELNTIKSFPTYSNSGCLLVKYQFSSFKETNDSIYFLNAKRESLNESVDIVTKGFQKGNIKIVERNNGLVQYVEIKLLIDKKIDNFKAGCVRTYFFTPTTDIKTSAFSDYGIFKPIHDK